MPPPAIEGVAIKALLNEVVCDLTRILLEASTATSWTISFIILAQNLLM